LNSPFRFFRLSRFIDGRCDSIPLDRYLAPLNMGLTGLLPAVLLLLAGREKTPDRNQAGAKSLPACAQRLHAGALGLSSFPKRRSSHAVGLSSFPKRLSSFGVGLSSFGVGLSSFGIGLSSFGIGLSSFGIGLSSFGIGLSSFSKRRSSFQKSVQYIAMYRLNLAAGIHENNLVFNRLRQKQPF